MTCLVSFCDWEGGSLDFLVTPMYNTEVAHRGAPQARVGRQGARADQSAMVYDQKDNFGHIPLGQTRQHRASSKFQAVQAGTADTAGQSRATPPPPVRMGNGIIRLCMYVLAEAIAETRQRLQVPRPSSLADASTKRNCCRGARAILSAETTCSLRSECLSRGVPLESVILASLFVAAAETVTLSEQTAVHTTAAASAPHANATSPPVDARGRGHEKHGGSTSARLQRGSVLGLVSVVMALLSGSVDSKALRYFCSFYAVFAGTSIALLLCLSNWCPFWCNNSSHELRATAPAAPTVAVAAVAAQATAPPAGCTHLVKHRGMIIYTWRNHSPIIWLS